MGKKIRGRIIKKLFDDISKEYKVIAPVKRKDDYVLMEVKDFSEVALV